MNFDLCLADILNSPGILVAIIISAIVVIALVVLLIIKMPKIKSAVKSKKEAKMRAKEEELQKREKGASFAQNVFNDADKKEERKDELSKEEIKDIIDVYQHKTEPPAKAKGKQKKSEKQEVPVDDSKTNSVLSVVHHDFDMKGNGQQPKQEAPVDDSKTNSVLSVVHHDFDMKGSNQEQTTKNEAGKSEDVDSVLSIIGGNKKPQ